MTSTVERADRGEDVADLLRELVTLNRAILAALERPRPPATLTRDDRAKLAAVLPAIGGVVGSELFTARELVEHSAPALRVVLVGLTARQLGRLLQRAEGARIDGFTVTRDGLEVGAILWRVYATP